MHLVDGLGQSASQAIYPGICAVLVRGNQHGPTFQERATSRQANQLALTTVLREVAALSKLSQMRDQATLPVMP